MSIAAGKPSVHLWAFFRYVLREFPLAKLALVATLLLLALEYASLSLMIPLAASSGGSGSTNAPAMAIWSWISALLGLQPVLRTWV